MKPETYVLNVAVNTEGTAATAEQRSQALDAAWRMAHNGYISSGEITTYAAKFADFLAGKGVQP